MSGAYGNVDEPSPSPLCGNHNSSFTIFQASTPLKDGRVVALLQKQNLHSLLVMVKLSVQWNTTGYIVRVSDPIWSRDLGGPGLPAFSFGVMDKRVLGISAGLGKNAGYGEINLTNGDWIHIAPLSHQVSGSQGVFLGSTFYSVGSVPGTPRQYLHVHV
jgi:hypothetical protein